MLTVRALIERYLLHVKQDGVLCPAALLQRERTLADFAGRFGDMAIADLRAHHLCDWVADHPGWKSKATRQLQAAQVKAVLSWAVDQERIERNPFRSVRYGRSERRPELPDEVLARMIAAANPCFANVLRFLRLTGCRIGELCAARWCDLDLERGVWTIPKHKGRRATKKPKILPLAADAIKLLRAILDAAAVGNGTQPEVDEVLTPPMPTNADRVFFNSRGTPYTRDVAREYFRKLRLRLGIPKSFSLHSIRHSAACAAIRAGVPIKFVSLMLGHRSVAVTVEFYDHVTTESDLEAVRAAAESARPAFEQSRLEGKERDRP